MNDKPAAYRVGLTIKGGEVRMIDYTAQKAPIIEISEEEARRIVKDRGLRSVVLTSLDEAYYFEGPQEPMPDDVLGSKPNKRPWVIVHSFGGQPEIFRLNTAMADQGGQG